MYSKRGVPLNPEVIEEWKRGTGLEIREGYGQTETVVLIANLPGETLKYGSMGKAVDPFDVCILNERNEPAADDEEGVISVRVKPTWPPGLFRGYHRDERLTRQSFQGDWYLTGDRARRDQDGYFWVVGRSDDVFKSSGYRISPFEVESALIEHEAVAECARDRRSGRNSRANCQAFVILAPGFTPSPALIRSLQDHVRTAKAP
jgi:acyl-coenzyme A synthetase/AMP-(fatty) acid ligase